MALVYKATGPAGKVFVGIATAGMAGAMRRHKANPGYGFDMHLARDLRRHGSHKFKFEVLSDGLSLDQAKTAKAAALAELGCMYPRGYNVPEGAGVMSYDPREALKAARTTPG